MKVEIFSLSSITKSSKRPEFIHILAIIVIWIICIIVVNPIGDFPLNDDWAYGKVVQSLLEKHYLQFPGEVAVTLITQALWGALFCLPFGFSFTALRFSTLTLGLIGILATYSLLRETGASRMLAFIGALLILTNPLYFALSNTFMTDVPFFSFSMLSFYFFVSGIKKESNIKIIIATALAGVATLTRQIGIIIPLSFGFAYIVKNGSDRKFFIKAFLPTVLVGSILIIYQTWLQLTHRIPFAYNCHISYLTDPYSLGYCHFSIYSFFCIVILTLIYLGLFLFPFLITLFPYIWSVSKKKVLTFFSLSAISIILTVILGSGTFGRRLIPLGGNVLNYYGIGPVILPDGSKYLPIAPLIFRLLITVIGIIGAALLLWYLFSIIAQLFNKHIDPEYLRNNKWVITLFLSVFIVYYIAISLTPAYVDRYQILLLPLLIAIVATIKKNIQLNIPRILTSACILMIILYGLLTVGITHDYLSLNRVRWEALRKIMKDAHLSADRINGGFEFNAWYSYDMQSQYICDKSWWWVKDIKDEYLITFGPSEGYKEIRRYPYKRWIPPGQGDVFVLREINNFKK